MTVNTICHHILRKGSTREERWGREELIEMFRSGELTPETKVYLDDQARWVDAAETDFAVTAADVEEEDEDRQAIREEYENAQARLADEPESTELRIETAQLAVELGVRDEAREHFQFILNRHPYHPRTVKEIKRHYSRSECRSFRYLDRPEAVWDNLLDLPAFPFQRGLVYAVVPAVVAAALSFLSFGGAVILVLSYLWCFQVMEYAARGASQPPQWNRSLKDPWRKLGRPALLMGAMLAEWAVVFAGATVLMMLSDGEKTESMFAYFASSPLLVVLGSVVLITYVPAAAVSVGGFSRSAAGVLDPRRIIRTIIRLEQEYIYSTLFLFVLYVLGVTAGALSRNVPVVHNIVVGVVVAFVVPVTGLILGRLLGRNGHLVS